MAGILYNEDPFQKIKKIVLPSLEQILVLAASFGSSPPNLGSPTAFSFQTPLGTFGPFGQFAQPAAGVKPPAPAIVDPISKKMISSELAWTRGAPHVVGGSYFQTSFYNLAKFKKNPSSTKTSTANCMLTIPGIGGTTHQPAVTAFIVALTQQVGPNPDLNADVRIYTPSNFAPPGWFPGETALQYSQRTAINSVNTAIGGGPPNVPPNINKTFQPTWPFTMIAILDSASVAASLYSGGGVSIIPIEYTPAQDVPNSLAWAFNFGTYDKRRTNFPLDSSQQPAWDTTTAISSAHLGKGVATASETHGLKISFPDLTLTLS